MRNILLTFLLILIPVMGHAWTDPTGSVTPSTVTTTVRDVRDIFNAAFDEANGMHKVTASTPTFASEVTQGSHDNLNSNANVQQGDVDVGTANRLYTQFSTTTAKNEPMQATHDELNCNSNMQQNDTDVSTDNRVYVQCGTTTAKVEPMQAAHDEMNVNANAQQGDADVSTDNRLYIQFSTTTAKNEPMQSTHDELNANVNIQQGDTDVATGNRVYVQCSSDSASIEATQSTHDELNSNANMQQENIDISISNPLYTITSTNTPSQTVDFSTPSANCEVFQAAHDSLNANANLQQGNTDVGAGNPIEVNISSDTDEITAYQVGGTTWNVGATDFDIRNLSFASDSADVTGSTIPTIGRIDETVTTTDDWYSTHTPTGTSGFLNSTGIIPDTAFDVTSRIYYVLGGDATVTESWRTGIIYLFENQPWNPPALKVYPASPTITVGTLTSGASIYYDLDGGN